MNTTSDIDRDLENESEIERKLRAAFQHRAEHTRITGTGSSAWSRTDQPTTRSRTPLLGVAAASVVVVGGLVGIRAITDESTSPSTATQPTITAPADPDTVVVGDDLPVVTADIKGIDLDAWQTLPPTGDTGRSFTIVDVDQLPDGFSLVGESASTFLDDVAVDPAATRTPYQARTEIAAADGTTYFVSVEANAFGPCQSAELDAPFVDINGAAGSLAFEALCWELAPGVFASLDSVSAREVVDQVPLIERFAQVARQLRFAEVDRLPPTTTQERAIDPQSAAPDESDFAGLIGGVEWSATVSDTTLRAMTVYVDGRESGGFSNDRQSQPSDSVASVGDVIISGSPGVGSLVFGYAMPEAAALVVRSGAADAVGLPLVRGQFESYFALPISDGVVIDSAEFVDEAGVVIATLELPVIPLDLGGTYGGVGFIQRI